MLTENEISQAVEEEIKEAIAEINALTAGVDYEDGVQGSGFQDKVEEIAKRRRLQTSDLWDALMEGLECDDGEFEILDEANPVNGLIGRGWIAPEDKEKWTMLLADEIQTEH